MINATDTTDDADADTAGDVTVKGNVTSTAKDVSITSTRGTINIGDVTTSSTITGNTTTTIQTNASGAINLYGTATSHDSTKLQARDAIAVTGSVTTTGTPATGASGDVSITTTNSAITLNKNSSGADVISTSDATTGHGGVTISSGSGATTINGNITAKGQLDIGTTYGAITVGDTENAYTLSGSSTNIHTSTGDINIYGTATSSGATTLENSSSGTITVVGAVTSTGETDGSNVSITTNNQAISLSQATAGDAKKGNVTVSSGKADTTIKGNADVAGALQVSTTTGAINVGENAAKSAYTLKGNTVALNSTTGGINLYGLATSESSTLLQTTTGNISVYGGLKTTKDDTNDVQVLTANGDISLNKNTNLTDVTKVIESAGDVTITEASDTSSGTIGIYGDVAASTTGNLAVTGKRGNITIGADGTDKAVTLSGKKTDISSINGNIDVHGTITSSTDTTVQTTGTGTITVVGEVASTGTTAEDDVLVQTNNQDISLSQKTAGATGETFFPQLAGMLQSTLAQPIPPLTVMQLLKAT